MTITLLPPARPTARLVPAPSQRPLRVVRPVEEAPPGAVPPVQPPRRHAGAQPHRRSALRPRAVACEQSYAADLHGSRLTRRGRLVVTAVWLLLAAFAAVGILRPGLAADPAPEGTTTVVVQPGDTMWALARALDAEADPRAVVDTIVELNGLRSGADIHPGDVLLVPASR